MQIFLSYASEDAGVAEEIALALTGSGHEVFFDRASLGGGDDFHTRIRAAVTRADLFIFLASPASLESGSYALTELQLARGRWPHPGGHLLPVRLDPASIEDLPAFLRSVTVLEPEGSVAAEVAARVADMRPAKSRRVALISVGTVAAGLALWAGLPLLSSESGEPTDPGALDPAVDSQDAPRSAPRSFAITPTEGRGPYPSAIAAISRLLTGDEFAESAGPDLRIELVPPQLETLPRGYYSSPPGALTIKIGGRVCSGGPVLSRHSLPPGNELFQVERQVDEEIATEARAVYRAIAQCAGL